MKIQDYVALEGGTFEGLFSLQAAALAEKPAIICDDEQVSYAELDRLVNRVAAALQRDGVVPHICSRTRTYPQDSKSRFHALPLTTKRRALRSRHGLRRKMHAQRPSTSIPISPSTSSIHPVPLAHPRVSSSPNVCVGRLRYEPTRPAIHPTRSPFFPRHFIRILRLPA